jgi:peptidoglycan/xylan/chitin deacetylase (PgdA/CDA1 family)
MGDAGSAMPAQTGAQARETSLAPRPQWAPGTPRRNAASRRKDQMTPDLHLPTVDGPLRNRSRQAVFLCYHSICDGGPPFLSLPVETFEHQLASLKRAGYVAGGHESLFDLVAGRRPRKPLVILTFDDGYEDNFIHAFPLLRAFGFTGLIFVLPGYINRGCAFDWPEIDDVRRAYPTVTRPLTWSMVETMAEDGIEFGSHTWGHRALDELSDEELKQELWDSRAVVKKRVGRCDSIAFPRGSGSARVVAAAAAAGYSFGFTIPIVHQRTVTRLSIPRIAVDHRDRGVRFALKLHPRTRRLWLSPVRAKLHRRRSLYT